MGKGGRHNELQSWRSCQGSLRKWLTWSRTSSALRYGAKFLAKLKLLEAGGQGVSGYRHPQIILMKDQYLATMHIQTTFYESKTLLLLPMKNDKNLHLSSVSIVLRSWRAYLCVGPFFPTCFRSISLRICRSEDAKLLRSTGLVSSANKYIAVCPLESNLSSNHSINPSSKQTNVNQTWGTLCMSQVCVIDCILQR